MKGKDIVFGAGCLVVAFLILRWFFTDGFDSPLSLIFIPLFAIIAIAFVVALLVKKDPLSKK